MTDNNEKVYQAATVSGGESGPMTLKEARAQVEAWESKGYSAYVEKLDDPNWEDVEVAAPITPEQVADFLGHDREALEDFVTKLVELLDWEVDHQDGGFMVYTSEAD
jgi:hypothetical protein